MELEAARLLVGSNRLLDSSGRPGTRFGVRKEKNTRLCSSARDSSARDSLACDSERLCAGGFGTAFETPKRERRLDSSGIGTVFGTAFEPPLPLRGIGLSTAAESSSRIAGRSSLAYGSSACDSLACDSLACYSSSGGPRSTTRMSPNATWIL
jgi:hypothetical protein